MLLFWLNRFCAELKQKKNDQILQDGGKALLEKVEKFLKPYSVGCSNWTVHGS